MSIGTADMTTTTIGFLEAAAHCSISALCSAWMT